MAILTSACAARRFALGAIVAVLPIATAFGVDEAALESCRSIEDPTLRLGCYDAAMSVDSDSKDQRQPGDSAAPAVSTRSVEVSPTPQTGHDSHAPPAATTRSVAVSPTPAESARDAQAPPAIPTPRRSPPIDPAPPAEVQPREWQAVVERVVERPRGEHVVVFDNGEHWQEQFASRFFPVKAGDAVTVRKRRFGGYHLITEGGKSIGIKRIR